MIKIENIHKTFGNLEVLKGVNLTIEQGKIVSIVGLPVQENQLYYRLSEL